RAGLQRDRPGAGDHVEYSGEAHDGRAAISRAALGRDRRMTRSSTPEDMHDPITEEAIAWFVRTHSDQRTLVDEDRFAQWLKQDPEHARAYERVERVWRAAGPQITPRPLESERRPSRPG